MTWMAAALLAAGCSGASQSSGADSGATGGGGGNGPGADGGDPDGAGSDGAGGVAWPHFAAGTRLRPVVFQTADGLEVLHVWNDSLRGDTCTFTRAADGKMRCLPGDTFLTNQYADAGCTMPLMFGDTCDHKYATTPDSCGNSKIFQKGAAIVPQMGYVFSGGQCISVGPLQGSVYATSEVAATEFVAADSVTQPRGDGVAALFYRGDDGSLQEYGLQNVALGQPCEPAAGRCAPPPTNLSAVYLRYSDAACQDPVISGVQLSCLSAPPPAVAITDVCGQQDSYYTVTGPFTGTPHILFSDVGCMVDTFNPERAGSFVALGAALPPASLPALTTKDVGTGRVAVRYQSNSSGAELLGATLYDTTLGQPCDPTPTSAGLRCLPRGPWAQLYADPTCTDIVFQRNVPDATCATPALPAYAITSRAVTICPDPDPIVSRVGARLTTPPSRLYLLTETGCINLGAPTANDELYATTRVAPTDLASITEVVK